MATGTGTPVATGDDGHYFTIAELRASDDDFASSVTYPDLTCEAARTWAETRFEKLVKASFVSHTGTTYTFIGDGTEYVDLPHYDVSAVTAATIDGTALTADQLTYLTVYPWGTVTNPLVWTYGATVVITYSYGQTSVPADVKQAVLILCREYLVTNLSSRATSESTDVGFIRLSVASEGRTGIPEVDAVIAEYRNAV